MKLIGYIDAVYTAGYVEGWACHENSFSPAMPVAVEMNNSQIAQGLANCYRSDLGEAGMNGGWCHFHLRVDVPTYKVAQMNLALVHAETRQAIWGAGHVDVLKRAKPIISNVADLLVEDPTVLRSIEELQSCEQLFFSYIKTLGPEMFVRTAYAYVLQRSADTEGLKTYTKALRNAVLSPFDIITTFASSEEFLRRPRMLSTPASSSFPFHVLD